MPSYGFWTSQARRWGACVDFGSPMSAWSTAMFAEWNAAKAENRRPLMSNVRKSGDAP
ncbi:hypothetical protein FHT10_002360 [Xanthomonas arboricola]|nr:hypothetical protein [Xanthomonas cannabis]